MREMMNDTTPKYIKMCEKAKKDINKKHELYDCYYDKEDGGIYTICSLNEKHPLGNNWHKDEIPLYRQDQLLGMIENIPWRLELVKTDEGDSYFEFCFLTGFEYWVGSTSEQAIIQGVMHKLYQKTWNEEKGDWI